MLTVTKEPNFARYTSDKAIVKDHHYYKGSEFSWNRPARMVEKYYPFYHKQHDENRGRIENMKEQEAEDNKILEEMKRERLIEMKAQVRLNYDTRAKERTVVQQMSKQRLVSKSVLEIPEEDSKAIFEVISRKLNSGKCVRSDEFSWNLLSQASKKNVNVFLGSYSVKGEEEHIKNVQKRIEKDNKEEDEKLRRRSERHDKIRTVFLSKHEENVQREEIVVRPVTSKNSLFNTPRAQTANTANGYPASTKEASGIRLFSPAENERLKSATTQKTQTDKTKTRPGTTASVERLAMSREVAKRNFKIDDSDLKGMLVQNMDQNLYCPGNNFYEALSGQSKLFQGILEENQKVKTSSNKNTKRDSQMSQMSQMGQMRPMTSSSNNTFKIRPLTGTTNPRPGTSSAYRIPSRPDTQGAQRPINTSNDVQGIKETETFNRNMTATQASDDINNKKVTQDEINQFENIFCRNGKKVGYARVNLEEAYRLTSANGLSFLQRVEAKKLDPLVK